MGSNTCCSADGFLSGDTRVTKAPQTPCLSHRRRTPKSDTRHGHLDRHRRGGAVADKDDAAKWARARAVAAEDEALSARYAEQYAEHKRAQAREARFCDAGPADTLRMYETGTNEKGQLLTQFEFEALCERWCVVFGELPPTEHE